MIKCIKKSLFFLFLLYLFINNTLQAQNNDFYNLDSIMPPVNYENIFVKQLYHDSSDVSSFLILIKKEVKSHKHLSHAEHVYVLEGEGIMQLGKISKKIKKGDFIFIPKNTFHSVITTSVIPLKVISLQSPFFDGNDRILKDD